MHEVRTLLLLTLVILKTLQQLQQNLLRNFTSPSLQICKSCQSKVCLQIVSRRIKRSSYGQRVGVLTQLQLSSLGQSILRTLLCILLLLLLLLLHHLMLLLLMVANLLFVGNPYWFSLLRLG